MSESDDGTCEVLLLTGKPLANRNFRLLAVRWK